MRTFLLKANDKLIDHEKSIVKHQCIYWKKSRNKKLEINDICYLYTNIDNDRRIRYKLIVTDICAQRDDKECWNIEYEPDNNCYKLSLINRTEGNNLTMQKLEKIGISKNVMFAKLSEEQIDYIESNFQK